jgi:hypothetical protein
MKPTCCKPEAGSEMADPPDAKGENEGQAYIIRSRDYDDIAHLQNATTMERFLEQPAKAIAGQMAEWLLSGAKTLILAGPKIAVAAITVKALEQFGKELKSWVENDKIPEDFAGRRPGWQSFVELFAEIDSNPTDEDRLDALKAMFLAANQPHIGDGPRMLSYQLFQIAKKLTSGELMLLKAIYETHRANEWPHGTASSGHAYNWRSAMASKCGHGLSALVEQNERKLAECGLISPILMSGNLETFKDDNARLTDLGIRFCDNIQKYEDMKASLRSDPSGSR